MGRPLRLSKEKGKAWLKATNKGQALPKHYDRVTPCADCGRKYGTLIYDRDKGTLCAGCKWGDMMPDLRDQIDKYLDEAKDGRELLARSIELEQAIKQAFSRNFKRLGEAPSVRATHGKQSTTRSD
jgi:hypothetical protein